MPRISTSVVRPFAIACLVAVASLGWTGWAAAAACSSTNYSLNTQAEVDALGATGCDSVSGYLTIRDSSDITNLDGLENLTSVGGYLRISNNAALNKLGGLDNFAPVGLAKLTSVGGSLTIAENAALTNLDGLASLTSVGGFLWISGNFALTHLGGLASPTRLGGLANLSSVGGYLWITNNAALTNLDGLANISSVGGDLYIGSNAALTNLDGLAKITSVGGYLRIFNNAALSNLDGLANITSVGGDLKIDGNDALANLDGLANITSVGGSLSIYSNATLTNLDGLANISSVRVYLSIQINNALTNLDGLANITSVGSSLYIYNNAALTNLDGLAKISSVGGDLRISYNDTLTNLDGLANLSSVGGYLYIDSNYALTNLDGLANIASVGGYLLIELNYRASCEGVAQLLGWPDGPPNDTVAGDITIRNNSSGCASIEQVLASVSGPTKPTITSALAIGGGGISVEFSTSTTTDTLFPITGYEAACIGSSADLSEAPAAALLDNTPVTRTLTVSGYDPVSVLSDIEVDIDITHSDPADLYITLTTPQGTELVLWDQGGSGGEDIAGTFPTTLTPIDTISSVGRQAMDGNWVLRVEDVDVGPLVREGVLNAWGLRISETVITAGSGSPITVNGVTRGRDYSCTVAPVTGLGAVPVSDAVTVNVPLELPATPTVTSTDYEDGTIRLTVSVADNGGADITEYSASCTDGTSTFTGTSSTPTIEVTGLTNGTAYTCSASATNAVGSSGASASTDSITPEALPTGLPVWLLYEATLCSNSAAGATVDSSGCSNSPNDSDGDGVSDDADLCPDTPSGESVDGDGCSASQKDSDGDGVSDDADLCPDTPAGESVDNDGCSASQGDPEAAVRQVYQDDVNALIVSAAGGCTSSGCHGRSGAPGGLRLYGAGENNSTELNYQSFRSYIDSNFAEKLTTKISGGSGHGGGVRYASDTPEFAVIKAWAMSVVALP